MSYYNRYDGLLNDDNIISPPFVKLSEKNTDKFVQYTINKSRLDKISQQEYGSPYFGWLILMANPELGGLEWNIKNGETLRIPYPLEQTLRDLKEKLKQRFDYYGTE
jgi:hypothetical protein